MKRTCREHRGEPVVGRITNAVSTEEELRRWLHQTNLLQNNGIS